MQVPLKKWKAEIKAHKGLSYHMSIYDEDNKLVMNCSPGQDPYTASNNLKKLVEQFVNLWNRDIEESKIPVYSTPVDWDENFSEKL